MSFGFRAISETGTVQIDDNFQNFVLVQEGVASGSFYNISLVDEPQNLIAMVRVAAGQEFYTKSNSNVAFDYRIYARQSLNRQLSGHGIIVNDAAGNRVFDSGVKKLNVKAAHYFNITSFSSEATFPSVGFRPYFGIQCLETTGSIAFAPVNGLLIALVMQQNADNSVRFFQKPVGGFPNFDNFWGGGTKSIILGD